MFDGLFNGLINFALFGLVVLARKIFHKEGIASFLIHVDKTGRKLFFEGVLIGVIFFLLYPISVMLLGIGHVEIVSNNLLNSFFIILSMCFGTLAVSVFEESLFRGYIFVKMVKKIPIHISILIISILFGSLHFFSYSRTPYFWLGLVNATFVAVLLNVIVYYTNSLMVVIGYHMSWNFVQEVLLSGKFLITLQIEDGILTGNDFTPEAGLIITLILVFMSIYVFTRYRHRVKYKDVEL